MKKIKDTWKSITIEKIILALAAAYAAYNFGLVGGYIEGKPYSLGGLAAGVVVNVSIAIASSRIASVKGDKRTRQAYAAFMVLLVISPALVAPVIYYSLPADFLGFWWLRAAWSLAYPLVADLAIVLAGAVTGKGLIALASDNAHSAAQSGAGAEGSAQTTGAVRTHKKRTAGALRDECAALSAQYACTEPQCGWSPSVDALLESAQSGKDAAKSASAAKAGHMKNKHPKPIAVDKSLLLDPSKKGGDQ